MEKSLKIVKIVTVTLFVVLLTVIAFCGTYKKQNNVWKKSIKEFNYGIELGNIRELRYVVDSSEEEKNVYVDENGNILGEVKEAEQGSEEAKEVEKPEFATEKRKIKANEENVKTKENFEKAKKIIQKRLENENVYEYNIRLDEITGELILEVPNDDESIPVAHTAVTALGEIEIIDDQTGVVLLNRDDIKSVKSGVFQAETGYQTSIQFYFNEQGTEKLKDITNKYREVVNDAGDSTIYGIAVNVDGQTISKTYFSEEISNGVLPIQVGQASTDANEINSQIAEVERIVFEINQERLPIAYTINSDTLIESRITFADIKIAVIVFLVLVLAISIVLVIKFKLKGFIASVVGLGFISLLNLLVRYVGIYVTLNSTISFLSIVVLNYLFITKILVDLKENENIKEVFINVMKKYYLAIVPVIIIAIVFTFVSNIAISSIGMILFWGLLLQVFYNALTILGLGLI